MGIDHEFKYGTRRQLIHRVECVFRKANSITKKWGGRAAVVYEVADQYLVFRSEPKVVWPPGMNEIVSKHGLSLLLG